MKSQVRVAILVLLVCVAIVSPWLLDVRGMLTQTADSLRGIGPLSLVIVSALYVAATVLMLPGSLLTIAAGFLAALLFPGSPLVALGAGYLSVALGSVTGATIAFLLGRYLARGWVEGKLSAYPRFQEIDAAVGREGLRMVFLLRLSPLFPFNFLNYALGLTQVKARDYVLASAIGMLPGTILYVYIGTTAQSLTGAATGVGELGWPRTILLVVGLIATLGIVGQVTQAARRAIEKSA